MNEQIENKLLLENQFLIHQIYEVAEHFGFETRNKYQLVDKNKEQILFIAEQQKGIFGFLLRQYLGHWRTFSLHFYDKDKNIVLAAKHPFRFIFNRLEIYDQNNQKIGSLQQRFSLFRRKFEVLDKQDNRVMIMLTRFTFFWIWSYPFFKQNRKVASVNKKFSGVFSEIFTDKDNFLVEFHGSELNLKERLLIIASSIFIDLMYFEKHD